MIASTHLQQLLTERPIVLWVEDTITKAYLQRIWQPENSLFQILIAGGNDSVGAVVHDLRDQGYDHVFGLADRDFGLGNVPSWNNPTSQLETCRPARHELENYLLDWSALEGCRENKRFSRTAAQIAQRAKQQAGTMVWWMACRNVLSDYRSRLVDKFPKHPKIPHITDQAQAENYLLNQNGWWAALPTSCAHVQNPTTLTQDLVQAHNLHDAQVNSGTWVNEFSGKEVFRSLRGYLFNEVYASDEVMDTDLAKSVGEWQVAKNVVPQELLNLKTALKTRTGV